MDFREYSIEELVSKITSKEMSARELTQEALNNLNRLDLVGRWLAGTRLTNGNILYCVHTASYSPKHCEVSC